MTAPVLRFREIAGLPQLAWVASAAPAGEEVIVERPRGPLEYTIEDVYF